MAPHNPALDADQLPRDWHKPFGERLVKAFIHEEWDDFPTRHQWETICIRQYADWDMYYGHIEENLTLPKEDGLRRAYHYYNKTATMYILRDQIWKRYHRSPVNPTPWLHNIYNTWAQECRGYERQDSRFVLGFTNLPKQDDPCLKWIGLGQEAEPASESTIGKMIAWHVKRCETLQARLARKPTPGDLEDVETMKVYEGHARTPKAYFSTISPTSKAVFVIGSHYQEMKSCPPTLNDISEEKILSRPAASVVEVSVKTAIQYLHLLERREEAANAEFRNKNDVRREAIYQHIVEAAHVKVKAMYEYTKKQGKNNKALRFSEMYRHDMDHAWKHIVEDERQLHGLCSTLYLRQMNHDTKF